MNENSWKIRWSQEQIRAMLLEQFDFFWQRETGIERFKIKEVEKAIHSPPRYCDSGLRRVGKSTLLAQVAHKVGKRSFFITSTLKMTGFQVFKLKTLMIFTNC